MFLLLLTKIAAGSNSLLLIFYVPPSVAFRTAPSFLLYYLTRLEYTERWTCSLSWKTQSQLNAIALYEVFLHLLKRDLPVHPSPYLRVIVGRFSNLKWSVCCYKAAFQTKNADVLTHKWYICLDLRKLEGILWNMKPFMSLT